MVLIIFSVLLTLTVGSDSARILAFIPTPSISHQVAFRPIALELAKREHEVVIITADPIFAKGKAPSNYTEIDVHDISYELWKKFVNETRKRDLFKQVEFGMKQIEIIFEKQLQTRQVQELLNDKKQGFDLLFLESWVKPTLAFSHIFNAPTILFSSLGATPGLYEIVGAPTHPSLYPLHVRQKINNLSLWDKVSEYYNSHIIHKMFDKSEESTNRNLKKIFGPDFPTVNELKNYVDMVFINTYPIWDFNRPVPPNVVYLGGLQLHQNLPKVLPQELKSYLDSSTNGVIYMSLGTNVIPSLLPRKTIRTFIQVFATLPYNVLWKWDQDELEGRPSNVNISKWFPQSDLLQHPNIKLFITQGGLQSTDESITAGVPLIGIPMLADQWYNTELYEHHKIGVKLNMETITEESLKNAINTVLKDDRYRNNIVNLRNYMRDQPQTPLERAVWWTEHVLRHGGARHLRSPAANITWAEYLELDLIALALISLLVLIMTLVFLIKLAIRLLLPYSKLKTK